ncbi:Uridine-cytidine kinase-like 1 [Verticillium dahliae VDG1]|nr:Uridine-cytidine kinase-like 1 [Verticillium dahliae VDG1]
MAATKEIATRSQTSAVTIDPEQTLKASKALLAHIQKSATESAQNSDKKKLLEDENDVAAQTPIWLTLTTKRHIADTNKLKPGRVPVPHSLHAEDSTICLIVASPQRAYKDAVDDEAFPAALRKRITRVIDINHLQKKFSQNANGPPRAQALGKTFYKSTAKRPIPVAVQGKKPAADGKKAARPKTSEANVNPGTPAYIAEQVEKALSAAYVSLTPSTNTAVKIGTAAMTAQQVADNVNALTAGLVERFVPQKWKNVRGIYIKGPETVALPIWAADELFIDDKDVVADATEAEKQAALEAQKANVGKKRKSALAAGEDGQAAGGKKSKKETAEAVPEADDGKLDAQIAERKEKLKKQKAKAKAALEN